MSWTQLILQINDRESDLVSELLSKAGAVSVTLQDAEDNPIYEPLPGETPLWQNIVVTGLFPADADINRVITLIQTEIGTLPPWQVATLDEQDWTRAWMDNFKPMRFGKRTWICPGWISPPDPNAVNIMLDPGLAFGTGTHPTTALCLRWLDQHFEPGSALIDYGCGSGILGIAALLLGASHVYAVDLDPQAIQATLANAKKNNVTGTLETFLPDTFHRSYPHLQTQVLVANILAGPLKELAGTFANYIVPGGKIVLSGILKSQYPEIIRAYQTWFEFQPPEIEEDWVMLAGTKYKDHS